MFRVTGFFLGVIGVCSLALYVTSPSTSSETVRVAVVPVNQVVMPVNLPEPRLPSELIEPTKRTLAELRPGESCFTDATALKKRKDGSLFLADNYELRDKTGPHSYYLEVRRDDKGGWHVTLHGTWKYEDTLFGTIKVNSFTWAKESK